MDKRATAEHSIHDLLDRRWSPRAFATTLVPPEVLGSILEAARWSASGNNEQPWRFIVTRNGEDTFNQLFSILSGRNQQWAGNAPILMLSLAKTINSVGKPSRFAYYDVGQAVANLTAQATAHDLYVHQMGGYDAEKARELFQIPADHDPVTAIAIGYYGDATALNEEMQQRESAERVRKPMSEIVFNGTFGNPLTLEATIHAEEK